MKKLMAEIMVLMMVVSFAVVTPAFADENEVVALKNQINDLNNKLDQLERKLTSVEGRVSAAPAQVIPAASATGGGLARTAQDIHLGGYIDTQWNNNFSNQTGNIGGNPLRSFDAHQNTFSVNQFDLNLQKTPNPEGGAGFNAEILAGEDAATVEGATLGTGANTTVAANPTAARAGAFGEQRFSLLQAYVEFVAPLKFLEGNEFFGHTVDIKAGRYVTLAGAEVINSTGNWNISRSFLFGLAIPFTHTGIRATYKLWKDKITTYWGINNGWDSVIDNNRWKTMEMGFSYSPIESISTNSVIYFGPENATQSGHKRFLWSSTIGWNATDKLSFNSEIDLGNERRVVGTTGATTFDNTHWWGLAGYARYKLTDKWGAVYRMELFRDPQAYRTGGFTGASTANETLWEMTYGTDYKFYDNLTGRLEYRLDKSNARTAFNSESSQSTVGAQLIYNFA